jgi:hypothetical protein
MAQQLCILQSLWAMERRRADAAEWPLQTQLVMIRDAGFRDRMTTDLFFTLQLLDCFPDLRLTADVSHYLVGREFAWPVDEVNHAMIHRILDHSWGIHGRIASREQVQISLGFPQHRGWVELFMGWWEYAIRSWRKRAGRDAVLTFLCELGPPPYAITGPDGAELSDRWQDALRMKDMIRALWQRIAEEDTPPR